ncbi:MAG: signal peptidase I [Clostridia bacterium]
MKKIIKFLFMLTLSIIFSFIVFYNTTYNALITKICGVSILKITSGSMENELKIGDIVLIKESNDYKVNDIITYNVDDKYLVTHRIIKRNGNNYITKGDNNNTIDDISVQKENIEGKVIYKFKLLKLLYKYWYIVIPVVILVLIIL